jgi:hypothetical protein
MFVMHFENTGLCKKKPTVLIIKEGRMVGARNQLHIKVATKTYETDHEMPCTAGIRTWS